MSAISEWVGAYMERTGKTKKELSEELGMSRTAFYSKVDGTTEFTLSEAGRLAEMMGLTTDQMLVSPFDAVI